MYINPINYSKQIKNLLVEMEIPETDPLADTVREFAQLVEKIDSLKAQLKHLEEQYPSLEAPIYSILENLQTVDNDVNKSIKVGNQLIVTFARKPYEQTKVKYKEAFEYLYGKVNGAIKKLADEAKDATASISKVKGSVKVTKLEESGESTRFQHISQEFSNSVDTLDKDFQKFFTSAAKISGGIEESTIDVPEPHDTTNRSYLQNLSPDEQTQLKEYIDSMKEIKKEITKLVGKAKQPVQEQGGNMSSGLTLKDENDEEPKVNWNWKNVSHDDAEYDETGKKTHLKGSISGKDDKGNYYTAKWKAPVKDGDADLDTAELSDIENTDK
jgi:hypothetical protein